ncbi:uncharacterized protein LOC122093047 [Macadamia integrifolia]|uniref:uncharacterized protein LOC122093047 n=1 Tax=Macadamia integrifolia TaxID=60698 RepID=UPI001C52D643|nr:uncharacterized protein LOC122093047 [Macadamia integrifolia]
MMESSTNMTPRARVVSLLFFVAPTLLVSYSSCDEQFYIYHVCKNTTLFASNSSYHSNLNILLSTFSSNSKNAYRKAIIGQSPNTVYGHWYCRIDVTQDVCHDCLSTAISDFVKRCPNNKVGIIWYERCTVRYSNEPFFSNVSDSPAVYLRNTLNITDPNRFNQLVGYTMNEAAITAASNTERFGTRETNFTKFQKIYSLVQCSPDLTGDDCKRCLVGSIAFLPSCCSGKQGGRVLNPSCNVRFEVYPFYRITASAPAPSPPPNKPSPSPTIVSSWPLRNRTTFPEKQGSSYRKTVAIIVPVAVAGVIILSILFYYLLIRKKKQHPSEENGESTIITAESLQFDFNMVLVATENFANINKIGEGGFGGVYKGKLLNGHEIAVKRLSKSSRQGAEEFKNEVVLVAKLQHCNLIRLLGFCLEGEEKILIYEFAHNKSLDYFLFDPEKSMQLDWQRRYKIIEGIVRGLLYLHEDSRPRIIHRDLKASNILLDMEMNPKISDFGMARIFGVGQTQANTNRIVGTYGYMSPEYAMHGQFSIKSDVFSFGVLVLEIISGKKNNSFYQIDYVETLISYAWRHWNAGTAFELIDPILKGNCSRSEVTRCIHIGLLCVQENVADRPTMANIILMLGSYLITPPSPSKPAFFVGNRIESESHIEGGKIQEAELEKQGSSSRKIVSIAMLVAAAGVILFSILLYCLLIRKKKENPGCKSPEYALHGQFSVKSDVFSFGVSVLETVYGKKSSSFYQTDNTEDLISYAWKHWNTGTTFEFIDPILNENCSRNEVMRCIHIGLLICLLSALFFFLSSEIERVMEPCTNKTPRATTVLLFFFVALSFLVSYSSCADKSYISHFCDNTTLFVNHSSYQSNLNILLSSLSSNATSNSNNGYRNASIGQSPNTVYGHYFCRGDATHDVFRDCVKAAATDIFQRCTNCKIGYIWYDIFTLRYSSQNFFSTVIDVPVFSLWNEQSVSDVILFNQLLAETMKEAATTAVSDSERFGTRDANFSQFQKFYCLAQCSPDISGSDCNRCLMETIAFLPSCCSGKQGGRVLSPCCNIRFEMFPFYRVTESVPSPHLFVSGPPTSNRTTSPAPEKQGSSSSKFVVIVVPIAAAGVIIFCILCFLIQKKKKGLSKDNDEIKIRSVASLQFEFSTVLAATKNFAEVNKIGEGGFGSVYKGKLPKGQEITVKRLSKHSEQGAEEFKNEVMLVSKIQHQNLVSLLGFCLEGEEKILIYEFVPNKSLNYFLFDPEKCKQLDWERRFNIVGGIARGLLYLHKDSHLRIIHRDLKASNILLDEEMNAKISDFGMARIFGMDQTQANTNRIVGTYGYMAPEYVMYGKFSVKSDVFSFGVLVLEIVSGKKNSSFHPTDLDEDLINHVSLFP